MAFLEHGVPLVHGVDGSYVEKDLRLLGEANFIERDLSQRITIDSKYDLACCLEVAEFAPNVLVLCRGPHKIGARGVVFSGYTRSGW